MLKSKDLFYLFCHMRVLMLGWEFDPIKSGGLGVACKGISYGLADNGVKVLFALPSFLRPRSISIDRDIKLLFHESTTPLLINSNFTYLNSPYSSPELPAPTSSSAFELRTSKSQAIYSKNFFNEIERFTEEALKIAEKQEFELIHAHDWMTFKAGQKIKHLLGKPLISHIHATEFDRTAGNPNPYIKAREQEGLEVSDHIIVVSNLTKQVLINYYNIPSEKITVIHNAPTEYQNLAEENSYPKQKLTDTDKIVLFLGRITVQKGPEFFVEVAKKVLSKRNDVKFIIAGHGDLLPSIIDQIIASGHSEKILCAGFLQGEDVKRAFYHADLYVMPSVSEPFGISALEAVQFGTPVLMSKTSGVSEVIKNALFADFWDVNKIANQVMAVLDYPALGLQLTHSARSEIKYLTWKNQTEKIKSIYQNILN